MSLDSSVSREYRKATPTAQTGIGDDVVLGIGNNTSTFNALPMTLVLYTGINNTYKTKITAADGGDKTKINERDDYGRDIWMPATDDYADYVDSVAKGNQSTVELSGFPSTKSERTSRIVPVQMKLDVQGGVSGSESLNFDSKTRMDADAFALIVTETDKARVTKTGNKITITFKNDDGTIVAEAVV